MKRMDVEKLLQWTYCDELVKGGDTSSASNFGIMLSYGELGTRIDDQLGPMMKLPPIFGEPHADALKIADVMLTIGKTVKRFGVAYNETATLLVTNARARTRPVWDLGPVSVLPEGRRGTIVGKNLGKQRGRHYYSEGSYCPLRFDPTLQQITDARAEYLLWWTGLVLVVEYFEEHGGLTEHIPYGPECLAAPWIPEDERPPRLRKEHARVLPRLTFPANQLTDLEPSRLTQASAVAGAFCV